MFELCLSTLEHLLDHCHIKLQTITSAHYIEHAGLHDVWFYPNGTQPIIVKRYHRRWLEAFPSHTEHLIQAEQHIYSNPALPIIRAYPPSPIETEGTLWCVYPFHRSSPPPNDAWHRIQALGKTLQTPLMTPYIPHPTPPLTSAQHQMLSPIENVRKDLGNPDPLMHTHTTHRDLRPDNVIWIDQTPYAIDLEHTGPRALITDQLALSIDWHQPWPTHTSTLKQAQAALLDEWLLWLQQLLYLAPQDKKIETIFQNQFKLSLSALQTWPCETFKC